MLKENEIALNDIVERFDLSEIQRGQLGRFVELLELWSVRTSLVSKNDRPKLVSRHIVDSLSIVHHNLISGRGALLDLGTGAGFPGLPLAIYYPTLSVTLLDSRRKKTLFLKEVVTQTGLVNVNVINARIEELQTDPVYDYIVARAVARLDVLWSWSVSHFKRSGILLALKGGALDDEVEELEKNHRVDCKVLPLVDKNDQDDRKLVVVAVH
jgi:16S rRNA (guanine527-N7)-methyltransferase